MTDLEKMPVPMENLQGGIPTSTDLEKMPVPQASSIDVRYLVNACAMSTQVQNVQMEILQGGIPTLTDLEKMPVPMENLQGGIPTSTDLEKMPVRSSIDVRYLVNACAMSTQVQNVQMENLQGGIPTSTDLEKMPVRSSNVHPLTFVIWLMHAQCLRRFRMFRWKIYNLKAGSPL